MTNMKLTAAMIFSGLIVSSISAPINQSGEMTQGIVSYEGGNESNQLGMNPMRSQEPIKLMSRDSVEVVLGAEDLANAARYAKNKVPEMATEWKQAIKDKIVNRLTQDKKNLSDKKAALNENLVDLIDKGDLKIISNSDEIDQQDNESKKVPTKGSTRTNIKSNVKDLGFKEFEYQKPDSEYDNFED